MLNAIAISEQQTSSEKSNEDEKKRPVAKCAGKMEKRREHMAREHIEMPNTPRSSTVWINWRSGVRGAHTEYYFDYVFRWICLL